MSYPEACRRMGRGADEVTPGPVFLNVIRAQESIPRNEFLHPMWPGGPVR